jgi:hypothetical protein
MLGLVVRSPRVVCKQEVKIMRFTTASILFVTLAVATGCTQVTPFEEQESVGEVSGAFEFENGLSNNGLSNNGLSNNGLSNNGLSNNGLSNNGLSSDNLAAIQDPTGTGTSARLFIRYVVACAFTPAQAFAFSWTDTDGIVHAEQYLGELGLAPNWATQALNLEGQRMVSACMATHVNYYGVHVTISARSGEEPLRLSSHDPELNAYPKVEGAFWGNLWAPTPYINACYVGTNVANSRAQFRDCAAGHLNSDGTVAQCGIINIVGSCASVCKKFSKSRGYYEDCRERPGVNNKRTDLVITTALP